LALSKASLSSSSFLSVIQVPSVVLLPLVSKPPPLPSSMGVLMDVDAARKIRPPAPA